MKKWFGIMAAMALLLTSMSAMAIQQCPAGAQVINIQYLFGKKKINHVKVTFEMGQTWGGRIRPKMKEQPSARYNVQLIANRSTAKRCVYKVLLMDGSKTRWHRMRLHFFA